MPGYSIQNYNPYNSYYNWNQYPQFNNFQPYQNWVNGFPFQFSYAPNYQCAQNKQSSNNSATVPFRASTKIQSQKEEKGLSTGAKWAIGLGLTALVAGGIYLATKGKAQNVEKLLEEKLTLSNLPENITFKKADTVEEGIRFAKEVLKVPEIEGNVTLEAINSANKGLVDVCNANKGKLLMTKSLNFKELEGNVIARVHHDIKSANFAGMDINTKFFDSDYLSSKIRDMIKVGDKQLFRVGEDGLLRRSSLIELDPKLYDLLTKELSNQTLTISEKRTLWSSLSEMRSQFLTHKDWSKSIRVGLIHPEETIYHEMGHLQDYATNLKELTSKNEHFIKNILSGEEQLSLDYINNRFLKRGNFDRKELLKYKNNPNLLKEDFPLLYEHLNNEAIQETAGKVSSYSREGVGEFVAETYAKMVKGDKLPDDVIALYKKYNGPVLNS